MFLKIQDVKKPNSMVPGDLPKTVVIEFSVGLLNHFPLSRTTYVNVGVGRANSSSRSYIPLVEDDIRNISGTLFFSKDYESFLAAWLLVITHPHLVPDLQINGS